MALSSPAARDVDVARSLREDPPLPGAPMEGWSGLSSGERPAQHQHEQAAAFACPMHPEVTSNVPGSRCPKCGMNLEPKR